MRTFPRHLRQRALKFLNRPTYVYRAYDAAGRLLHVGSTSAPRDRLREHVRRAPWYPRAARVECARFPTLEAALAAEHQVRAQQEASA